MPEYFPTGDSAREYIAQQENPFPDHERLLEEYPPLPDVVPIVFRGERKNLDIDPPAPIVVKALDALKKSPDSPKRILDIGSDTGRHSLYLAQHGYTVVGVDTNGGALEMAREAARTLGIPNKYFIPREMDAKDLPSTERYDAVISSMVMHFVDRAEGRQMVRQMQDLTVDKGLNVVSVYTDDNPEE